MKKSFTQEMTWLHTWSGLVFGWALFAIFLTGTICVYWMEISVWARPELHAMHVADRASLTQWSVGYLQKNAAASRRWSINMPDPDARNPTLVLTWANPQGGGSHREEFLPDGSGRPVTTQTHGGRFFVDFHWTLNTPPPYGPAASDTAIPFMFIGATGIAFLIGTISGVIIHKKIFKDFFTFRPKAKSRQRSWLDAHNVLGVLPWPFHVMIVVTGLAYACYNYLPSAAQTLNGGRATRLNAEVSAQRTDPATARGAGEGLARRFGGANSAGQGLGPAGAQAGPPVADATVVNASLVDIVKRAEAQFGPGSTSTIAIRNPGRENAVVDITRRRDDQIAVSNLFHMTLNGVTGQVTRATTQFAPVRSVWDTVASLHFAFFGGAAMRLLYFVCGLAGTAMMACGLLLFTVKRREKAHSPAAEEFYKVVDRVNVAAVAGAMFACMAYLWAVRLLPDVAVHKDWEIYSKIRLLPVDELARPDWEILCFWGAWIVTMIHASLRSPHKAWVEQLAATAVLCLGLPVLGFIVPNSSLPAMMAAGDWKTAGVDLTSLAFGICLAWGAWKVSGKSFSKLLAPAPGLSAAE